MEDQNSFNEAVKYAVQVANGYLRVWRDIELSKSKFLEIGPGTDFAASLVLASCGAEVTVADKYLAAWRDEYHPQFYEAFLAEWEGPSDAIRATLMRRSYDGVIRTIKEPAERMPSLKNSYFNCVNSNAVLEHVSDFEKVAPELARVTKPGGIHAHQIDFRDHRNFEQPLDYLRLDRKQYKAVRNSNGSLVGTAKRLPEAIEAFAKYFWVCGIEVNSRADENYVEAIMCALPSDSPYRYWPRQIMRDVGARLWLVRKNDHLFC